MERRGVSAEQRGNRRRRSGNVASTALGREPEKRGLTDEALTRSGAHRQLSVNVKTAKRRTQSSANWLERQLNDPYVARSKAEGYRSRSAYKLIELDEKFHLLRPGARIVDLGCAPGGWLQVATKTGAGKLVGIDCLPTQGVAGAEIIELDFLHPSAPQRLREALGGSADLVLSDMAAPATGHKATDHLRVIALAEAALDFALTVLSPDGAFACKVFQGGSEGELLKRLKANFTSVRHAKPKASRAESAEVYVVATGFRGL
jgi:23S rRNA (uridine2552-2'-O)-methyltransferase